MIHVVSKLLYYYLNRITNYRILSIISGQGVFGVRLHAKNTRLPRLIEMIQIIYKKQNIIFQYFYLF